MQACIQSRSPAGNQSVLEHGDSVLAKYEELIEHAREGRYPEAWRAPTWWTSELACQLAAGQPALEGMRLYLRYHDCGKPFCLTVDDTGRSHFPGHAEVSANLWASMGGHTDEVWLMQQDMLLHTGSAQECESLRGHRLGPGLFFAALAEVHANAAMFGGIESNSFKAKFKQVERRGKALYSAARPAGQFG